MELEVVFEPLPGDAIANFIKENIHYYNIAKTGVSSWNPVGFFLKSPRGEWFGGVTGYIWGGWMHVDILWVMEAVRGQGHGSRLMDAAERFAIERGAIGATLETHSFQSPQFYAKRGYEVFGTLDDYPRGHTKLFLRKRLSSGERL